MKKLSAALMALLLSACSSQVYIPGQEIIQPNVKPLDRDMYLRGDFTLWDAEPHYKLGAQQPGIYTVRAKFMTPGKVYEFKIADESWSKGFNCGYQSSGSLQLNKPLQANCDTVYNYFSFAPSKKGWYTITFDYRNSASPMVMVSKG